MGQEKVYKQMKKRIVKNTLILLLGMIGGCLAMFLILIFKNDFSDITGSIADWIGSVGTVASLIFIYIQIIEAKNEYEKQHTSNIKIEVISSSGINQLPSGAWVASNYNDLQIWAVNISDAAGSYRYVGLCKEKDYVKVENSGFYNQELILNDYTMPFYKPITQFKDYNSFEKIEEKSVSKIQTINGEQLVEFLSDDGQDSKSPVSVYLIYMDYIGKPILRELRLRINGKQIELV